MYHISSSIVDVLNNGQQNWPFSGTNVAKVNDAPILHVNADDDTWAKRSGPN